MGRRRAASRWRCVFAAVGFWEYETRQLLLNPKVIASNQVEEYFRVNSLFFDPNIYGRFLALVMIGLAAVLLWARRPRDVCAGRRARSSCSGAACCTTLSQSSFAALLLGPAVLAWLRFRARYVAPAPLVRALVGLVLVLAFPVRAAARPRQLADRSTTPRPAASS